MDPFTSGAYTGLSAPYEALLSSRSAHGACRDTVVLGAASQINIDFAARPAPRPNNAQSSDVCIDLTVDLLRAKNRTLQRLSVVSGRVTNIYGSMNRAGTKRARDASAQTTLRAAFGIVDQEQLQIDGEKHKNMSFNVIGDCDDLVHGSKQPATRDEHEAFAQNFHPASPKRHRVKSGHLNMICSDTTQPLVTSFLDYPRDMQPRAHQDEHQARETTVGARTGHPVGADTSLGASPEALLRSLAARIKLPKSQVILCSACPRLH